MLLNVTDAAHEAAVRAMRRLDDPEARLADARLGLVRMDVAWERHWRPKAPAERDRPPGLLGKERVFSAFSMCPSPDP